MTRRRSGVEAGVFRRMVELQQPPTEPDLLAGVDLSRLPSELLRRACTHTSYANEKGGEHYQRLEFLGDSVLKLCASEYVFRRFPEETEGQLSQRRHHLEDNRTLAAHALRLGLHQRLLLGKGDHKDRDKLHADIYEALVGAIYLSLGLEQARRFVEEGFAAAMDPAMDRPKVHAHAKSVLQERCQRRWQRTPIYQDLESFGPDHCPTFRVQVQLPDGSTSEGRGGSKREAEREAAVIALQRWAPGPGGPSTRASAPAEAPARGGRA